MNTGKPPGGFDSTKEGSGNKVNTPAFDVGEKRAWYNDSTKNPGYSIFAYLRFVEGSDSAFDTDADISTGYGLCFHMHDASEHTPDGDTDWYYVTHDLTNSEGTLGGAVAIAMCDLSGGAEVTTTTTKTPEYGWFWVGGVCPCNTKTDSGGTDMTKTAGEIVTGGSVAIGQEVIVVDDGTNAAAIDLACPTIFDSTTVGDASTWGFVAIGRALATDA